MPSPVRRKVSSRLPIGDDYELHVNILAVKEDRFIEVRYYIPSTKTYGRGVVLPSELAEPICSAISIARVAK